jgi:hypothetical protein
MPLPQPAIKLLDDRRVIDWLDEHPWPLGKAIQQFRDTVNHRHTR